MTTSMKERELVDIISELVRKEIAKQMIHVRGIDGRGGDTIISSTKNIYLTTLGGGKAYYNGTEIVAMSAPGDVVKDTATNNKLLKWTNASTKRAGNSNISDDGTNVTVTLGSGGKLIVTS